GSGGASRSSPRTYPEAVSRGSNGLIATLSMRREAAKLVERAALGGLAVEPRVGGEAALRRRHPDDHVTRHAARVEPLLEHERALEARCVAAPQERLDSSHGVRRQPGRCDDGGAGEAVGPETAPQVVQRDERPPGAAQCREVDPAGHASSTRSPAPRSSARNLSTSRTAASRSRPYVVTRASASSSRSAPAARSFHSCAPLAFAPR